MHAELRRVDVDADDYGRVLGRREADQREVADVECAHRGDEADGAVFEELFAAPLAEGGDVAEDFDGCVWDCGLYCSSIS